MSRLTDSSAVDRDRDFVRLTGKVLVFWAVFWTAVIVFLLLFGRPLPGIFG